MTITGLRIPADGNEPIRKVPISGYEDINRNVGGYIEAVFLWSGRVTMYVHEEGLLKGLRHNARASWLRPKDQALVGDVLLLGPPDGEGDDTGITDKDITDALTMIAYKPEAIQAVLDEASLEALNRTAP